MLWLVAALACAVLFFLPGLLQQFDVPKTEWVRVWGIGALAMSLIAGRAGRPRRWRALDVAVAAWLAVEALATALSVSPVLSLIGEPRQREGLLTSVALAGLYFGARDAFARPERPRRLFAVFAALAAASCAYALVQVAGADFMEWRREAVYSGGYVRPFATLGHPNLLGVVTAAAAAAALALALGARGPAARWAYTGAAALAALVTVLTLSRAAWLALLIALPMTAFLAVRERQGSRRERIAVGIALIVALAAGGLLTAGHAPVGERITEAGGGGSAASRFEIWRTALAAWRERPLTGQGPDLFELVFPRLQTEAYWRHEWTGLPVHAHNIGLHALATRGVLGLLAGLGWAMALAWSAWRAWRERSRSGDAGAAVIPAAVGTTLAIAAAGMFGAIGITGALLIVIASAALAALAEPSSARDADLPSPDPARRRGRGHPPRKIRRRRTAREWLALAAGLIAAALTFQWVGMELRASRAAAAAQEWMTSRPDDAVAAARYAVTLAPHDDRLTRMLAEALLWQSVRGDSALQRVARAEEAARRAVSLAPRRAENHVILARAYGAREGMGDTTARAPRRAALERALALAPHDALLLVEWAEHEVLAGRGHEALAPARRAVSLYPGEGMVRAALARAWIATGEPDSALAELDRALAATWRSEARRREAGTLREQVHATLARRPATH